MVNTPAEARRKLLLGISSLSRKDPVIQNLPRKTVLQIAAPVVSDQRRQVQVSLVMLPVTTRTP